MSQRPSLRQLVSPLFRRRGKVALEARLRELEERLRFVQGATNDGVWEWDAVRDVAVWSDRLYEMLKMSRDVAAPSRKGLKALTHPDDHVAFEECCALSLVSDQPYFVRLRLRRGDGEYLQVLLRGRTGFGPDGKPVRSYGTLTDLTAVLEAERTQRTVERRSRWTSALLDAQLNSSPDGIIIVDLDHRRILQNTRMAEVWDLPPDTLDDDDDERQFDLVCERISDVDAFKAAFRHLDQHPTDCYQDEVALLDGRVLERHSVPAAVADGTIFGRVWNFRDITERFRAEEAMRRSNWSAAHLDAQLNSSPDGILIVDAKGKKVLQNRSMAELWGIPDEVVADPDDSRQVRFVTECTQDPEGFVATVRAIYADPMRSQRDEILLRNGTVLDRHTGPAIGSDGTIYGRIWTFRDITARVRAESGLREAQEELEARVEQRTRDLAAATREAERANEAKSEFLSRMSHELRTPMNAILGFGQLLRFDELSGEQEESVDQILRSGAHLLRLINEVLDISGIESGRLTLSKEPVDVHELVAEAFAMVSPLAAANGVEMSLEPVPDGEGFVQADRQRLLQVAINLVSNAIKYNFPGGEVRVGLESRGGRRRLLVQDTGIGIPEEKWGALFSPFERLGAQDSEVEGTGLGLALSRRLVLAMDGEIGLLPRHTGTCFYVDLPASGTPLLAVEGVARFESAPQTEPCRADILLVEDNPANIDLMRRILRTQPGYSLRVARRGDTGLTMVREKRPDLVLLDMDLPDLNGLTVLRRLRENPATATVPIVVVSADANPAHVRRAREAGADDYLTKPYDVRALLARIAELTTLREPRSAA